MLLWEDESFFKIFSPTSHLKANAVTLLPRKVGSMNDSETLLHLKCSKGWHPLLFVTRYTASLINSVCIQRGVDIGFSVLSTHFPRQGTQFLACFFFLISIVLFWRCSCVTVLQSYSPWTSGPAGGYS